MSLGAGPPWASGKALPKARVERLEQVTCKMQSRKSDFIFNLSLNLSDLIGDGDGKCGNQMPIQIGEKNTNETWKEYEPSSHNERKIGKVKKSSSNRTRAPGAPGCSNAVFPPKAKVETTWSAISRGECKHTNDGTNVDCHVWKSRPSKTAPIFGLEPENR